MGGKTRVTMNKCLMEQHQERITWVINDDIFKPRVKIKIFNLLTLFCLQVSKGTWKVFKIKEYGAGALKSQRTPSGSHGGSMKVI